MKDLEPTRAQVRPCIPTKGKGHLGMGRNVFNCFIILDPIRHCKETERNTSQFPLLGLQLYNLDETFHIAKFFCSFLGCDRFNLHVLGPEG